MMPRLLDSGIGVNVVVRPVERLALHAAVEHQLFAPVEHAIAADCRERIADRPKQHHVGQSSGLDGLVSGFSYCRVVCRAEAVEVAFIAQLDERVRVRLCNRDSVVRIVCRINRGATCAYDDDHFREPDRVRSIDCGRPVVVDPRTAPAIVPHVLQFPLDCRRCRRVRDRRRFTVAPGNACLRRGRRRWRGRRGRGRLRRRARVCAGYSEYRCQAGADNSRNAQRCASSGIRSSAATTHRG
jgi:hypothetical protein